MPDNKMIIAIGRIERALSRLEQLKVPMISNDDNILRAKHEALKSETQSVIQALDSLIDEGRANG
jgi:hypothetical protein